MQMNLPGSVIGACRRAVFEGTVIHSLIPATVSSTRGPFSRNARVLLGTSAAAISDPRVTPRRVRVAATLAGGLGIGRPGGNPSGGAWRLGGRGTGSMGEGLLG